MFESPYKADTKRCKKCGELKLKTEFWKRRTGADGLNNTCKECEIKRKKNIYSRPKLVPTEKQCPMCLQTKLASKFWKDGRYSDGLHPVCSKCRKEQATARREKVDRIGEQRICGRCGQKKPITAFRKEHNRDGRGTVCKECHYLYSARQYARGISAKVSESAKGPQLATWEHVETALREMAELQIRINDRKAYHKRIIEAAKSDMVREIKALLDRQLALELLIKNFVIIHRQDSKPVQKNFKFGSVLFKKGQLSVRLNLIGTYCWLRSSEKERD